MSHCNAMICQQVTLSGYAEWPKVADAVIEARLLMTPDADIIRVLHQPFASADYHLSAKCDGCPYNALCFIDAAERHDLSVVPLLTATEKRVCPTFYT